MAGHSVSHTSGRRKCIVVKSERTYKVRAGDLGTAISRDEVERKADFAEMVARLEANHRQWHKPPRRKRGDITTFSANSQSRLRVALSTAKWKGGECRRVGLTLTLPWAATPDEWRDLWASWVALLGKRYKSASVIWRIELTTGKAKTSGGFRRCHVHAMVWLPVDAPLRKKDSALWAQIEIDEIRAYINMEAIARTWIDNWMSRKPSLTEAQMMHAISIGGDHKRDGLFVQWLDKSTDGAIHYLCDHATKHKEEQLGWNGRQWGIINRRNFDFSQGKTLDGRSWALASRQLRRISQKRRKDKSTKWQLPYGDNKCWFGKSEKVMQIVLQAAINGDLKTDTPQKKQGGKNGVEVLKI